MSESDKSKDFLALDTRVDDLLAITNALQILLRVQSFRNWMETKHSTSDCQKCIEGYMFAFRVLIERLHEEIERDVALGLSSDPVFERAAFTGRIPIYKLPNSCDKTLVLKNIHKKAKAVLKATDWTQIEEAATVFRSAILSPLIKLKSVTAVNPAYSHLKSLDEAIRYATMFELYIFLNDTGSGAPHGYPQIVLKDMGDQVSKRRKSQYLIRAFTGYKYAVQFMWSQLLGRSFNDSPLSYIHRTRGWDSFDKYFEPIRAEVIQPAELDLGTILGMAALTIIRGSAKEILLPLFDPAPSEPILSEQEELEQLFLWYEIELIDASQDTLFNGAPAFVSALLGSIEIKRRGGDQDKTKVIRLMHPKELHGYGNLFSYAVLMDVVGLLSDSSGWLLFFDCCYDTGSGRRGLEYVEQFIREYVDRGLINVQDRQVTKQTLLSLMAGYLISATKKEIQKIQESRSALREIKDRFDTSRGLLLEFVAYYLHSYQVDNEKIRIEWNYTYKKLQIDVIARLNNRLLFVECTNCADKLVNDAKRIRNKAELLWQDGVFRKEWDVDDRLSKEYVLFCWNRPSNSIKRQINNQKVMVRCLSDEFDVHPMLVRKARDKMRHVFGEDVGR
jgi:hypothetical protein